MMEGRERGPDTPRAQSEFIANTQRQILFVINQPDVYKSPSSNTWM